MEPGEVVYIVKENCIVDGTGDIFIFSKRENAEALLATMNRAKAIRDRFSYRGPYLTEPDHIHVPKQDLTDFVSKLNEEDKEFVNWFLEYFDDEYFFELKLSSFSLYERTLDKGLK